MSSTSANGGTVAVVVVNNVQNVRYTPPANFVGADTFTYTVRDNGSPQAVGTGTVTVTVTVSPKNDAPIGGQDNVTVQEDLALVISGASLTANDAAGPANESGQTLTVTKVTKLINQTPVASNTKGTVVLSGGNITYTPPVNYSGPDRFTYTATDNGTDGTTAAPKSTVVTVLVNVTPANDAPTAIAKTATVAEEGTLTMTIASFLTGNTAGTGDTGQALSLQSVQTTTPGASVQIVGSNVIYHPAPDFAGATTFTYTIVDNGTTNGLPDSKTATGTVTVTVTQVNDAPIPRADAKSTTEDKAITFAVSTLLTNDAKGPANESTQALSFVSASTTTANGGTVQVKLVNNVNSIIYTPRANFFGVDSFTYVAKDNGMPSLSATGTVNVTVSEVNDPITTVGDSAAAVEDTLLVITASTLVTNDSAGPGESGQTLTVTAVNATTSSGGQATLVGGQIRYLPATDFVGTDAITVTVTDNGTTNGAADPKSATATINVTVGEVNDAPNAVNKTIIAGVGQNGQVLQVLTGDTRGPANESSQTLSITGVTPGSAGGTIVANANGTVSYSPPSPTFVGTETFTYTVQDNGTTNGTADAKIDTATVTVDVKNYLPNTFSGYLYFDPNNDGAKQSTERAIAGIEVTLTGTNVFGQTANIPSVKTVADGFFSFDNVVPGNYVLKAANAQFTVDGKDGAGTQGDTVTTDNDQFTFSTTALAGTQGTNNRFAQVNLNGSALGNTALTTATTHFNGNGILLATKLDGTQFWQSFLNGWAGIKGASIQLNFNATSATLTIVDGLNVTHARTLVKAASTNLNEAGKFQIIGTAPNGGGYLIKVNGRMANYNITSGQAPEGPDLFLANLLAEDYLNENTEEGDESVDRFFAQIGEG